MTGAKRCAAAVALGLAGLFAAEARAFSVADASATEGGMVTFTVTAAAAVAADTTLMLTPSIEAGDTASGPSSMTADLVDLNPRTVTIMMGQATGTASFATNNDDVVEADETFTVTLSGAPGGATVTRAVAVGTIFDNDQANITIGLVGRSVATEAVNFVDRIQNHPDVTYPDGSMGTPSPIDTVANPITEGGVVTVTLATRQTLEIDLHIPLHVSQTGDYLPTPGAGTYRTAMTIPAGQSQAVYEIRTVNDREDEPNGSVTAQFLIGAKHTNFGLDRRTINVEDDDVPRVSVVAATPHVLEGGAVSVQFNLTSDIPFAAQTKIPAVLNVAGDAVATAFVLEQDEWTVGAGATAPANDGFQAAVTLAAATTERGTYGAITVSVAEPAEGAAYALGDSPSAVTHVYDNADELARITANAATVTEGEDAVFTITRTQTTSIRDIRVLVTTAAERAALGSFLDEADRIAEGLPRVPAFGSVHTVSLIAGAATGMLRIPTTDDDRFRADEVLEARLVLVPAGLRISAATNAAQVRVVDNDDDPVALERERALKDLPEVGVVATLVREDEAGSDVTIDNPARAIEGRDKRVQFTVRAFKTVREGTAVAAQPVTCGTPTGSCVMIRPSTETRYDVEVREEPYIAPAGGLRVKLNLSGSGDFGVSYRETMVTIAAGQSEATIFETLTEDSVNEANGSVTATVLAGDDVTRTITYFVHEGATIDTTNMAMPVTPSMNQATVPVTREVSLPEYRPANRRSGDPQRLHHSATVLLEDDDIPVVTLTRMSAGTSIGSNALFDLGFAMDPAPYQNIRVRVETVLEVAGQEDVVTVVNREARGGRTTEMQRFMSGVVSGSATGKFTVRLLPGPGFLLPADQRQRTQSVYVVPGTNADMSLRLERAGGAPGDAPASLSESESLVLVLDADTAPSSNLSVMVQLAQDGAFLDGVTADGMTTQTLTFGSTSGLTQRFAVDLDDDAILERAGSVTATLMAGTGYTINPDRNAGTVAVHDNDIPEFNIEADAEAVTEGGMANFTITASSAPLADMTLNIAVLDASGHLMGTAPTTHRFAGDGSLTLSTLRLQTQAAANVQSGMITARLLPGPGYTLDAGSKIYTDASGAAASPRVTCYLDEAGMPTAPSYETATACTNSGFDFGSQGNRPSVEYTGSAFSRDNLVRIAQQVAVVDHRDPRNRRVQSPGGAPEDFTPAATTTAHEYVHVREARIRVDDDSSVPTVRIAPAADVTHEGMPVEFVVTASAAAPAGNLAVSVMVAESDPAGEKMGSFLDTDSTGMQTVTIEEGETEARLALASTNDYTAQSGAMAKSIVTATLQAATAYAVAVEPGNAARMELVDAGATRIDPPLPEISITAQSTSVMEGEDALFTVTSSQPLPLNLGIHVSVTDDGGFVDPAPYMSSENANPSATGLPTNASIPAAPASLNRQTGLIDAVDGAVSYDWRENKSTGEFEFMKVTLAADSTAPGGFARTEVAVPMAERSATFKVRTRERPAASSGSVIMVELVAPSETRPAFNLPYTVSTTAGSAQITITDSPTTTMPTVSVNSPTVAEASGGAMLTFTISVDEAPGAGNMITMMAETTATGSTATAASDYTAYTARMATISGAATSTTVEVAVLDDTAFEVDETVTLMLSSLSSGTVFSSNAATLTATGTITDNEVLGLQFDRLNTAVNEGETAEFRATIGGVTSIDTTVTVLYTVAGTATAVTDYTEPSGTLDITTLTPSDNAIMIPVLVDSEHPETAETLIIDVTEMRLPGDTANNPRFATLPADSAAITITSVAAPSNTITAAAVTVAEDVSGGMAAITVNLSAPAASR